MKKFIIICLVGFLFFGCSKKIKHESVQGKVLIDGSSTVYPITEAIAEEFNKVYPKIRVTVSFSGTGGGFKKFLNLETDINAASRNIKDKEKKMAENKNIEYFELPVAYDGISVVINPENSWAKTLTVSELNKMWGPSSKVKKWSDLRSSWPNEEIKLYGPGTDSGTFDYFTKAINGKAQVSRSDFTKSEDDNVLVMGVAGDKYALGYFGFAYYKENKKRLDAVAIDAGDGPVKPTEITINNGSYKPLSRPMYIYVSKNALQRKAVQKFVQFYLENASKLVGQVGYVALGEESYKKSLELIKK